MFTMATQEDYPGWGYMLKNGATTLWEDWEGKESRCHSSYLRVGAWFIEGLAGIRPGTDGQGYQNFLLKPGYWRGCPLGWVKCRFDSPYGIIESDWKREGGKLLFQFVVPPNTTATAFVRADNLNSVRMDGHALSPKVVIGHVRETDVPKLILRLEPGRHAFEVSQDFTGT